jgi:hypothetical protein
LEKQPYRLCAVYRPVICSNLKRIRIKEQWLIVGQLDIDEVQLSLYVIQPVLPREQHFLLTPPLASRVDLIALNHDPFPADRLSVAP